MVIESGDWLFYGLVTDLQLGATDPRFADEQSETRLPGRPGAPAARADAVHQPGGAAGADAGARPRPGQPGLCLLAGCHRPGTTGNAQPAAGQDHPAAPRPGAPGRSRAISPRSSAKPDEKGNFVIGYTREQGHPVCINLDKFVQRSSGIFGATGTGKSFLTRIILAGLIQYNRASVLVFDMHNEYGFDDTASDTGQRVTGLQHQVPGAGARGRAGAGRA